jgi:hypothetical protein
MQCVPADIRKERSFSLKGRQTVTWGLEQIKKCTKIEPYLITCISPRVELGNLLTTFP